MALKTPTPGLRVFHNSISAQRFTITVPAGAELTVPWEVASQMNAESSHAEVDAAAVAEARARAAEQEPEPPVGPEPEPGAVAEAASEDGAPGKPRPTKRRSAK